MVKWSTFNLMTTIIDNVSICKTQLNSLNVCINALKHLCFILNLIRVWNGQSFRFWCSTCYKIPLWHCTLFYGLPVDVYQLQRILFVQWFMNNKKKMIISRETKKKTHLIYFAIKTLIYLQSGTMKWMIISRNKKNAKKMYNNRAID